MNLVFQLKVVTLSLFGSWRKSASHRLAIHMATFPVYSGPKDGFCNLDSPAAPFVEDRLSCIFAFQVKEKKGVPKNAMALFFSQPFRMDAGPRKVLFSFLKFSAVSRPYQFRGLTSAGWTYVPPSMLEAPHHCWSLCY